MWPRSTPPYADEHTQSTTVYPNEQLMLLAAQSASVQQRRRTLRKRQRPKVTLAPLVIPSHPERAAEDDFSSGSSEEPRSRFSHSTPPSPLAMHLLVLPASTAAQRKRKSILAKFFFK